MARLEKRGRGVGGEHGAARHLPRSCSHSIVHESQLLVNVNFDAGKLCTLDEWHNYGQLGLINAEGARQGTLKRRSHIRNGRIWRQMRAAGL